MSFIMRLREDSFFYKEFQTVKLNYNIPKPYVGIQVRRTDKGNEGKFFEVEEYMVYVEEFFETYLLKNPHTVNVTERAVFVATDDAGVVKSLVYR